MNFIIYAEASVELWTRRFNEGPFKTKPIGLRESLNVPNNGKIDLSIKGETV